MRIDLFDMDEFVDLNNLKEVTSPVLFERGGVPNPNGLISNEIFGVSIKSRRETFAYISLNGYFITPHIYKIIRRVFRNIDKIINGEYRYIINKNGSLERNDDLGDTGIEFLYENWDKIKWNGNGGMSSERTDLISKSKKNEIWISKEIVIPAFYRDIHSSSGGGGETSEVNNLYTRLIRYAALLKDRDMFDFAFHINNYNIQNTLVEIYDYFKEKLEKKNGLLRKYLLGKNVDYCVRTVISAPIYNCDNPMDNIVDFDHCAVPIHEACSMCYPFVVAWLRNFFEREVIENQSGKYLNSDIVKLKNPESYFNDTYIEKAINRYIHDPSSRYDTIAVPVENRPKPVYLRFSGRYANVAKEDESTISERALTWTDLLFMATSEITKDKYIVVTRYPIANPHNIFLSKMRIASTLTTVPMIINDTVYRWYPNIDLNMTKAEVSDNFIDTLRFSNSYLVGMTGDYDGDQTTAKILWTQEANAEAERIVNQKSFFLNADGKNDRIIELEAIQCFYCLTKDPDV